MLRNPSPLTLFFLFVALLASSLLAAAVLATPVFHLLGVFPIHRVFNRIAMLVFLAGAVLLLRRLALADRQTLGFQAPPVRLATQAVTGFMAGLALLGLLGAVLFALGVRTWSPRAGEVSILGMLPGFIMTGIVVAMVEETFFRGAMFGAIRRNGSALTAVSLTSVLYSAVHFLGERFRIPPEEVEWNSGFVLLSKFFGAYSRPLEIVDAFIALAVVGALLGAVREKSGNIAGAIGLHAGFVTVLAFLRKTSVPQFDQPWSFLVGRQDGVVGWLVAIMAGAALLLVVRWPKPLTSRESIDR